MVALLLSASLLAASFPAVSDRIVSTLESQVSVLSVAPEDTGLILVHGSSHIVSDQLPTNTQLTPVALSRLTEGVRLWNTKPDTIIALSGATPVPGTASHAEKMHQMALLLGVPEEKIIRFDEARDTEAEINSAVLWLEEKKPGSRLVAVSTAMHLPRSELLLTYHNIKYALAPTEFIVSEVAVNLPSVYSVLSVDRALHEWIGILWVRLKKFFS